MNCSAVAPTTDASPRSLQYAVMLTPDLIRVLEASAVACGVIDEQTVDEYLMRLMRAIVDLECTGLLEAIDGHIPAVPQVGLPPLHCFRFCEPDGTLTRIVVSLG